MSDLSFYGLPLPPSQRRIASTLSKLPAYQRAGKRMAEVPKEGQPPQPPPPPKLLDSDETGDPLGVVRDCGRRKKAVIIDYPSTERSAGGERLIYPYSIQPKSTGGRVFLWAWCSMHGGKPTHSFDPSLILRARETDQTYNPPSESDWPLGL